MALNPDTNATMAGRVTPASAAYPYGSSKNETSPGAGDGTPYFEGRANDVFGFQQWLLDQAGIVPSGNADTVSASDYGNALLNIIANNALDQRSKFTFKDIDEVYLDGASYLHSGTKRQYVFWGAQLTYQFTALTSSDWSYLYLDDSAIVSSGSPVITVSELTDSITEPTWNQVKQGWYNGLDKCIFAVRTDGSSEIIEFFHEDDLVMFADDMDIETALAVAISFTDISPFVRPSFSKRVLAWAEYVYVTAAATLSWRTNGQLGPVGHSLCSVSVNSPRSVAQFMAITDDAGIIEVAEGVSSSNTADIKQLGWLLPIGM